VLGVLLASFTFYAALAVFLVYYLLLEVRSLRVAAAALVVVVVTVVAVPVVSDQLSSNPEGTRVIDTFWQLDVPDPEPAPPAPPPPAPPAPPAPPPPSTPEAPPPPPPPASAAFNQAPDLLVKEYGFDLVRGDLGARAILVGSGLGSFNEVIADYYLRYFDEELVTTVNSRLLPFTLLVETGVIGVALFLGVLMAAYLPLRRGPEAAEPRTALLRLVLVSTFIASALQVSFVFSIGVVVCLHEVHRRRTGSALGSPA
jgi:hypothetical protein